MTRIRRLLGPLLAVLTLGALLATAAPDVAHAAVGDRLDNSAQSDRSVKIYKSSNCYDNPSIIDTKIVFAGHSSIEGSTGWARFLSIRIYADSRIIIDEWTTGRHLSNGEWNVTPGSSRCINTLTDNRRYTVSSEDGIVSGAVAADTLRTSAPSAAITCENIRVWNASSTEYIRLKRENGTTRDLQPLTETSGSYRYVQVPPTDDVRVTEYSTGGPTSFYYSDGYHRVIQWGCGGWNGYAIRIN